MLVNFSMLLLKVEGRSVRKVFFKLFVPDCICKVKAIKFGMQVLIGGLFNMNYILVEI